MVNVHGLGFELSDASCCGRGQHSEVWVLMESPKGLVMENSWLLKKKKILLLL